MKKEWDLLYDALAEFQFEMEDLIPELPQSKNFNTRSHAIRKKWALLQKLANELNEKVTPANPIPVNSPFDHIDFINTWQMWKDYLQEQHAITMKSRMEVCGLKRLAELSNADPMKAIKILTLVMSTGYKNFFAIEERSKPVEIQGELKTSEGDY